MSNENKRRIVELEDEAGIVFPQTHISAVIDSNRRPLNELLENIQAGNADLTEIRSAITELQNQIFPLTSSLTLSAGKTIFEYTGKPLSGSFDNSISFRGSEIDRKEIETFELTTSSGITDISYLGNKPATISFKLPIPENFSNTCVKSYSASLKIVLKNGRTTNPTCNFSQIAPSWVGWSDNSEIGNWLNKDKLAEITKTNYMKKLLKTSLSGTYIWDKVEMYKSFWIIVPKSSSFSGYSTVIANDFPATITNMGTYNINGIEYQCFRNSSGPVQAETRWKMVLSNN